MYKLALLSSVLYAVGNNFYKTLDNPSEKSEINSLPSNNNIAPNNILFKQKWRRPVIDFQCASSYYKNVLYNE